MSGYFHFPISVAASSQLIATQRPKFSSWILALCNHKGTEKAIGQKKQYVDVCCMGKNPFDETVCSTDLLSSPIHAPLQLRLGNWSGSKGSAFSLSIICNYHQLSFNYLYLYIYIYMQVLHPGFRTALTLAQGGTEPNKKKVMKRKR